MTEQHVPPLDDLPLSASDVELPEGAHAATVDTPVQVRSLAKRELDVRIMPWNTSVETPSGPEEFRAGAFSDVDPDRVLLMGLEHEVHLGLGQNGNVVPTRRPTGKGLTLEERDDGAYMTFRVAKTAAGDEMLALAEAEVVRGVSVEFVEIPGGTTTETRNGRRTRIHHRVALPAVSPTYRPAYVGAQVLAVRSQQEDAPVAEQEAPANGAAEEQEVQLPVQYRGGFDADKALSDFAAGMTKITDTFGDRLERLEERARSTFEIPGAPTKEDKKPSLGTWMEVALKILSGERIPNEQMRVTQDFITTDNAGVVPDAYSDRIIGVIDPARPFMATTERIPTPDSGMSLVVPIITQRPSVAEQLTEKALLSSTKSIISTESFAVHTYGGVGDLSLQLLKRSDPSFLELYLRLLAEAYAIETEDAAVSSLITAVSAGGPEPASALNPNALNLGASFQASFDAVRRPPDTIWMSSEAVAEFIDAKASGTNAPLYSNLSANFTAAGGVGGTIQGLRAVHVPALDDKGAYAIVGPSTGFAWAEDGTYTLQVDVPSKAGRDVALVGMVWFVPWYPEAFTLFNVAS
jgi:HK97 family phage major capsid protein